ncbi:hypothetical protein [Haloarcula sp. 1CSR25-25]|jgi:hypothetical protein|uniref:hypothetical protein n=1 Tax=Haloarcula sp. 1CSR25-25 TaxID=2862545 RepID=UPI002893F3F2|nr:hypothetical protein [Haloarcula sp. 1CSR25-25]MDT3436765.1 hypothetical protein [Haloarcula sp. 1CSR25-25]
MSAEPFSEFSTQAVRILEDELTDIGGTKLQVSPELRLSYFNPFLFDSGEKFTKHPFDAIVYREVSWEPTGLDQIDDLERWFLEGTDSVEIPIAVVEFTEEQPLTSSAAVNQIALESLSKFDALLPIRVRYARFGSSSPTFEKDNNIVYSKLNSANYSTIQHSIVEPIKAHIARYSDQELLETFNLEEKVRRSDPEIFYHFNDVLWAYNHDRNNILVILLSVYFENYVKDSLEDYFEEAQDNPAASNFYDDDWGFDRCLNGCRSFGLIEDEDYNTINKIRDARNDYAHDIESFDSTYSTDAEDEGLIQDGIQLYEELIGVKKSIIDE